MAACAGAAGAASAGEVVRLAAARIGVAADELHRRLDEVQLIHAWQLAELLPDDWAELGVSLGLRSAVRRVLVEQGFTVPAGDKSSNEHSPLSSPASRKVRGISWSAPHVAGANLIPSAFCPLCLLADECYIQPRGITN